MTVPLLERLGPGLRAGARREGTELRATPMTTRPFLARCTRDRPRRRDRRPRRARGLGLQTRAWRGLARAPAPGIVTPDGRARPGPSALNRLGLGPLDADLSGASFAGPGCWRSTRSSRRLASQPSM